MFYKTICLSLTNVLKEDLYNLHAGFRNDFELVFICLPSLSRQHFAGLRWVNAQGIISTRQTLSPWGITCVILC